VADLRNRPRQRCAVITALTKRLPDRLGRTAVMKLMYFLQTLRGVHFGYLFGLYNYGPFDSQVLDDLGTAEQAGAVVSKEFRWAGGSGYVLSVGPGSEQLLSLESDSLASIKNELDWVVNEFGSQSASELELASTIVYVDQVSQRKKQLQPLEKIVQEVHSIRECPDRC
jgi:uncharacterized protein